LCYVDGVKEANKLVWMDRTGKVVGTIEPPDVTFRPFPAISPDGRSVAMTNRFGDSRELFLYDLSTGVRRRLTFTDYPEEIPRWHPNGVDILDYSFAPERIYSVSTRMGSSPRVLAAGIMPAVSPDGSMLVYSIQRAGDWNFDILVRPIDGDSADARFDRDAGRGLVSVLLARREILAVRLQLVGPGRGVRHHVPGAVHDVANLCERRHLPALASGRARDLLHHRR
jgi:hypothetical protein